MINLQSCLSVSSLKNKTAMRHHRTMTTSMVATLSLFFFTLNWDLSQGGETYEHLQIINFGAKTFWFAWKLKLRRKFTFQQKNGLKMLEWPSQSLNLNPTENCGVRVGKCAVLINSHQKWPISINNNNNNKIELQIHCIKSILCCEKWLDSHTGN